MHTPFYIFYFGAQNFLLSGGNKRRKARAHTLYQAILMSCTLGDSASGENTAIYVLHVMALWKQQQYSWNITKPDRPTRHLPI